MNESQKKWLNTQNKELLTHEELTHLEDFLSANPEVIPSSLEEGLTLSAAWTDSLNSQEVIDKGSFEIVFHLENELYLVHLLDDKALAYEGKMMGHCVSSYKGHKGIYSIWEGESPKCTIEVKDGKVVQVRGKANGAVAPSYIDATIKALEFLKCDVKEINLISLGYLAVENYTLGRLKKIFKKIKVKQIGSGEYIYLNNKLELNTKESFPAIVGDLRETLLELLSFGDRKDILSELYSKGVLDYNDFCYFYDVAWQDESLLEWLIERKFKLLASEVSLFSLVKLYRNSSLSSLSAMGFLGKPAIESKFYGIDLVYFLKYFFPVQKDNEPQMEKLKLYLRNKKVKDSLSVSALYHILRLLDLEDAVEILSGWNRINRVELIRKDEINLFFKMLSDSPEKGKILVYIFWYEIKKASREHYLKEVKEFCLKILDMYNKVEYEIPERICHAFMR